MKRKNYRILIFMLVCFLAGSFFFCTEAKSQVKDSSEEFQNIRMDAEWKLRMQDKASSAWKKNWFLDGLRGEVINTDDGKFLTMLGHSVDKVSKVYVVIYI